MSEVWKQIDGYENYQISNFGRIKRLPSRYRKTEMIIRQMVNRYGYHRITLWKNGQYKRFSVHRLVMEYFSTNPLNKQEINHKDSNPANNRLDNLEWCTHSENVKYAFQYGNKVMTKGESCSWSKIKEDDVHYIRKNYPLLNMRELAEKFNLNKTTVWEIIHRKIWCHI